MMYPVGMETSSTAIPDLEDSAKLVHLCKKEENHESSAGHTLNKNQVHTSCWEYASPLTTFIGNMGLISAMEDGSCDNIKWTNWRLCLVLDNVNIVLDSHLKNGVASTSSLNFHSTPSLRNLQKRHQLIFKPFQEIRRDHYNDLLI